MYGRLNKNEHWAWDSCNEGPKKGWKLIQCDWMPLVRPRYQGVSYWVVPLDTTQANAGVKAGPDDGRGLWGSQAVKIGTTHNLGSSLRVWVGNLSRPASYKTMLDRSYLETMLVGSAINEVDPSLCYELCAIAFKTFCQDLCFMRPWYVCCWQSPMVTHWLHLKLRYH